MAVAKRLGDPHCRRTPMLALHVDDTLVGFRGGQRIDREAHLVCSGSAILTATLCVLYTFSS
jgi:hypothetical protein